MQAVLHNHIEATPDTRGGRPRIVGTRITVEDVMVMYCHLGESVEVIAIKYDLPLAAVHAALAYYYDHKAEIDARRAADDEFVEEFKKQHPSLLREKLRALGHG